MMGRTGPRVQTFLRSLTIQGSWNYRTMIGTGVAFTLLPILRRANGEHREKLEESLAREGERFNAHPYLAELVLGACARMEEEDEDPGVIRRFKTALGGALGGVGDSLVWAGWVPACVLVGVMLQALGAPPWITLLTFLALYNAGHLSLRIWGYLTGLREGREVGRRLGRLGLSRWAKRIEAVATVLLGAAVGVLILRGIAPGSVAPGWTLAAAAGFVTGLFGGQEAWRPTLNASVGVLAGLLIVGALT